MLEFVLSVTARALLQPSHATLELLYTVDLLHTWKMNFVCEIMVQMFIV